MSKSLAKVKRAERKARNATRDKNHAIKKAEDAAARAFAERDMAIAELKRLQDLINKPQIKNFLSAVRLEAVHQRERWGTEHDAGKDPADWLFLAGFLGGKAVAAAHAGDTEKALHHTISSAAVLLNWHAAISGDDTSMRPGIEPPNGYTIHLHGNYGPVCKEGKIGYQVSDALCKIVSCDQCQAMIAEASP